MVKKSTLPSLVAVIHTITHSLLYLCPGSNCNGGMLLSSAMVTCLAEVPVPEAEEGTTGSSRRKGSVAVGGLFDLPRDGSNGGNILSNKDRGDNDGKEKRTMASTQQQLVVNDDHLFLRSENNNMETVVDNRKLQSQQYWTQLGYDLRGSMGGGCILINIGFEYQKMWLGDWFGTEVSLSGDGSVLAVGAPYNDGTNGAVDNDRGRIWVFKYVNDVWTTLGGPIVGEATNDHLGPYFSLSSDGKVLADGTPFKSNDTGCVRVHQFSNNVWTRLGGDINGEAAGDTFGRSISLSSDGKVLAVGAPGSDPGGRIDAGHVRVYQFANNVWTQLGGDIVGEAAGDQSGCSISLSSNGKVLAVGAWGNDPSSDRIDAGHVRVYQYVNNIWTQLGSDIDGVTAGGRSGSVSLSSNGSVLAVGKTDHVQVYQYKAGDGWVQQGNKIAQAGGFSSHSLSGDGYVLAVGQKEYGHWNPYPTNLLLYAGRVQVYRYVNGVWTQLGSDIIGAGAYNYFGYSVSLSSNGSVLAGGAPSYKNDYVTRTCTPQGYSVDDAGLVRVYQYNLPISVSSAPSTRKPTLHPTTSQLTSKPATRLPTAKPINPTRKPSSKPTRKLSSKPTRKPSSKPTSRTQTIKPTTIARFTLQAPICNLECYNYNGNMFDVKAKQSVSIKSLKMYIGRGAIAEVWTKVGTYDGFENSFIGWTKVAEYDFTSMNPGTLATIPESSFSQPITITAGSTQALYVTLQGAEEPLQDGLVFMSESDPTSAVVIEDNNLIIYAGTMNRYFFSEHLAGYNWNGALMYAIM